MSAFKRVTLYEDIEMLDPKERENIIHLLASYDHHLRKQNAVNILATLEGVKVMNSKKDLDPEFLTEIEATQRKMRIENFKPTDLKRLTQSSEIQMEKTVNDLIEPKLADVDLKIQEPSE